MPISLFTHEQDYIAHFPCNAVVSRLQKVEPPEQDINGVNCRCYSAIGDWRPDPWSAPVSRILWAQEHAGSAGIVERRVSLIWAVGSSLQRRITAIEVVVSRIPHVDGGRQCAELCTQHDRASLPTSENYLDNDILQLCKISDEIRRLTTATTANDSNRVPSFTKAGGLTCYCNQLG